MSYSEDEYFQLSAIQHFIFCKRQCALAYMEMNWQENELTALGHLLHSKAHKPVYEKRGDLIIVRGLWVSSCRLGISGQADVIEFHKSASIEEGCIVPGFTGTWRAYPVEYKHGKPKTDQSDIGQLCAQAMCLEEMLAVRIDEGAIFYGKKRKRLNLSFTSDLREYTKKTIIEIHELLDSGLTPPAKYSRQCHSCSLYDLCLPQNTDQVNRASAYLKKSLEKLL